MSTERHPIWDQIDVLTAVAEENATADFPTEPKRRDRWRVQSREAIAKIDALLVAERAAGAAAERGRLVDVLRLVEPLLRNPDNGHSYCRWCDYGKPRVDEHEEFCSWRLRVIEIDKAKAAVRAVLAEETR